MRQVLKNQQGAALLFVTISLVVMFAFAVLSIDVSLLYVTRTQLQNAADAAALAGALGMMQSQMDTTTAVDWAIETAGANQAFVGAGDGSGNVMESVVIAESDIEFPEENQIRVTTHRTEDTADPIRTMFVRVIDPVTGGFANVTATATAGFGYNCGSNCLRPWVPPDRWFDADGDGTFNPDSVSNPDEYYDPVATGYVAPADLGAQVVLKLANGNQDGFGTDWYYAVDFPPVNKGNPETGANVYRDWIMGCRDDDIIVEPGDLLKCEPGNMVGPTRQGLAVLMAQDPGASWDAAGGEVVGSAFPTSPRIIKACLFDPSVGRIDNPYGGGKVIQVIKVIAFFVEGYDNQGDITARFMQQADPGGEECDDPNDPTFLYTVKLVQ
ncbi:MAG: pilus assembly protein TadG-related protein [Candidatus Eisenbacteria bacterium]